MIVTFQEMKVLLLQTQQIALIISLPRHKQLCLMRLYFKRYFSHHLIHLILSY